MRSSPRNSLLNVTGFYGGVWGFAISGADFLDLQTKLCPCFRSCNFVCSHLRLTRVRSMLSPIVSGLHLPVVCLSLSTCCPIALRPSSGGSRRARWRQAFMGHCMYHLVQPLIQQQEIEVLCTMATVPVVPHPRPPPEHYPD